jgi:lipoprotein-anchoring transpeptidase ErfK/SrfK
LPDPGAYVGVGREVVVILSTQMTYAYEDGVLVRSVLTSTGLPATPTVQGDYKIYRMYDAQLMSGPGYYLPGVPWVMYFYQGYAFHGAYWHSNWGNPMSHGCVNMPIEEAAWLYSFVSIGTPVHVRWA